MVSEGLVSEFKARVKEWLVAAVPVAATLALCLRLLSVAGCYVYLTRASSVVPGAGGEIGLSRIPSLSANCVAPPAFAASNDAVQPTPMAETLH